MKGRFSAVCMVAVMLTTMLGAPLAASGEVMQETTIVSQEITTTEPRDYPNGWTHRPVVEVFTSLSCSPPCERKCSFNPERLCLSSDEPMVINSEDIHIISPILSGGKL